MVTEAIKLITGIGEPLLGRLMVYDALEMSYRTVRIRRDPAGEPITELIDYAEFCGTVSDDAATAAAGSTITAVELKEMMDSGKDFVLIDVREPHEYEIVRIPGSTLIPKGRILSGEALAELPQDKPLVLHCKSGQRSAEALAALHKAGSGTRCTSVVGYWLGSSRLTPRCPSTNGEWLRGSESTPLWFSRRGGA
jgi:adenylyltransferase/sulfurtransferase